MRKFSGLACFCDPRENLLKISFRVSEKKQIDFIQESGESINPFEVFDGHLSFGKIL